MRHKADTVDKLLKMFVITFFSLSILFLIYAVLFVDKALPNTYFGHLSIAGKEHNQISKIVDNQIYIFERRPVVLNVGGEIFELSLEELGVEYDNRASTEKIIDASISSNPLEAYRSRFASLFLSTNLFPLYIIDQVKLSARLDELLFDLEKQPLDAHITFIKGAPILVAEESGVVVDRSILIRDLSNRLDSFSNAPLVAVYTAKKPKSFSADAKAAFEKIQELENQSITLSYAFDSWELSGDTLSGLLELNTSGKVNGALASLNFGSGTLSFTGISFSNKSEQILEVGLNEKGISVFIDEIAVVIDKATINATLEFDGVKVSQFTPAQDGRALDKLETKNLILDIVSTDSSQVDIDVLVNLPVKISKAVVANEEINSLGIKELIASGTSYFQGSITNRKFNIGLGAELINGAVVAPGDVFSFNELVGPVSSEQGFKQAYVINKGRTVLDDGGGICQVSTTTYRAALNAGLPIVERTAHAYRVVYYEQRGFEPGYDATIWSPTVDLKFRNDTGRHILVQAIVDTTQSKLQVDIYGTADGREVELTKPVLTARKPAPEPLYQDDPTLPTGTTKQVDWAAEGLTSVFSRIVTRDGEVIIDEKIRSNFRPWQAVYLVGTGT